LKLDICFSPDLLSLYDLRGKVAVIVDVLRATSTIVTAQGVPAVFPVATLEECAELGRTHGYITAAERDGVAAEGFDLGNSPFGFLDGKLPVRGRNLAISTTNGTRALHLSLAADAVVCGAFLNLQAVVKFAAAQQRDVVVVCAGWKGQFCLEDSLFGGALAEHRWVSILPLPIRRWPRCTSGSTPSPTGPTTYCNRPPCVASTPWRRTTTSSSACRSIRTLKSCLFGARTG
jgi:2-phosphosulfolactate phosphatase